MIDGDTLGGLDFGCTFSVQYVDPLTGNQLSTGTSCNLHIFMPDASAANNTWRPMCPGMGSFTATAEDDCTTGLGYNECELVDHVIYIP